MMLTVLHSDTPAGVTFCQAAPPSFVSWMFPSSVPTQMTPSLISDGAIVKIVPRTCSNLFHQRAYASNPDQSSASSFLHLSSSGEIASPDKANEDPAAKKPSESSS